MTAAPSRTGVTRTAHLWDGIVTAATRDMAASVTSSNSDSTTASAAAADFDIRACRSNIQSLVTSPPRSGVTLLMADAVNFARKETLNEAVLDDNTRSRAALRAIMPAFNATTVASSDRLAPRSVSATRPHASPRTRNNDGSSDDHQTQR